MKSRLLPLLAALLSACTTPAPSRAPDANGVTPQPTTTTRLAQAATSPLSDLNLVRVEIPQVLKTAQKKPYALPDNRSCAALGADIAALDDALGADLDIPPTPEDSGLIESGTGFVGDAAIGAVRGAAQGLLPFRIWVRKLTGAERYSKEVAAALAAGVTRRAFLKGLGQAAGCQSPAAPRM